MRNEFMIYPTQKGKLYPIEKISDEVFAEKALGDGVFIIPSEEKVYAPVSGVLKVVADTKHAYGIVNSEGLEVLIHVGINSVDLDGNGIESYVQVGQNVEVGDLLCKIDFEVFKKENISTETAIVITNFSEYYEVVLGEEDALPYGQGGSFAMIVK